jgi:hypothetical protein
MSTLTVKLSDHVHAIARARAAERGCTSVDEYLASLIEADGVVPLSERREAEILAGLATPGREMTSGDWDDMRRRFRASKAAAGAP